MQDFIRYKNEHESIGHRQKSAGKSLKPLREFFHRKLKASLNTEKSFGCLVFLICYFCSSIIQKVSTGFLLVLADLCVLVNLFSQSNVLYNNCGMIV